MNEKTQRLVSFLSSYPEGIYSIVDFDHTKDKLLHLDFTESNTDLSDETLRNTAMFSKWVERKLKDADAKFGIGGYNEHRTIYSRSIHFDTTEPEPRRLHLGTDIWGEAGTAVFAPLDATVHSFAFNNKFGDYGSTIVLGHECGSLRFYSLFGHLNLSSLNSLTKGMFIPGGTRIAEFGKPEENGFWPPHLHFQLIFDLEGMEGDYPGVCRFSEREKYLLNCPDPQYILNHTFN